MSVSAERALLPGSAEQAASGYLCLRASRGRDDATHADYYIGSMGVSGAGA
jgi:hypothetical protein